MAHMNAHMLSRKIIRQGYFWTIMEAVCVAHVQKCHAKSIEIWSTCHLCHYIPWLHPSHFLNGE